MSVIDLVREELTDADIQQISEQLGADPVETRRAIDDTLPMMVGGMAGVAKQPGGEAALQSTMQNFGGLDGGLLGSIFGDRDEVVQGGVQKASGFDSGKAKMLLMLLAPFLLRALAKRQANPQQPDAPLPDGGLAGTLERDAQNAQVNAPPNIGGILGKILGALT